MLKVRDNKLEWTQIMRSNDIYLGLPYNLIQFTSLQEIIAGWLKINVGSYCHYSDSLHLYHKDLNDIGISEDKGIRNEDSLLVDKDECFLNVNEIYSHMVEMSSGDISEQDLSRLSELDSNNTAYKNIMYIIALYVAEKKNYTLLSSELQKKCSNELYLSLWSEWRGRNNHG